MTISIPSGDIATFSRLPKAVRDEVHEWLPIVNDVIAQSHSGVVNAIMTVSRERTLPWQTVRKKYYAAKRNGWKGLINGRKLGVGPAKISSELIPYWHGLVLANKRSTARAYGTLVRQYRSGEHIPGLPPPELRGEKFPIGKSTLTQARYLPPKASVAMARYGVAASRAHLPHGPQDISHIRPLEYVVFDDVELDFLIIVPESPTPVKLRLIVAMDLCSRVILGYGVRPAITRADGVEDGLKLRDMKAVVAQLLRTWGVPAEYHMHFIVERATAALPDAAKAALAEISGNRIVVHDTSMIVGQVFEFRDKASGNSWGKAWLESFFNSLHGELAHLPGQKGRRYDLAPAELDGRRKELAAIVKAGKRLPLELRHQFQWPFKTCAEALQELDSAFARLHERTDHGLLCFDRVMVWRTTATDTWKTESEMPEWMIPQIPHLLTDTRVESPMERWQRLIPQVERHTIADCSLQRLMDEQKRVRFADLQFSFERDRTAYTYLPTDAMLPLLTEGDHYILWFHPHEMSVVYVTKDRPHLGYIGKLSRFTAGRRGDLEDAKNYMREKARLFGHAQTSAQQVGIDRIRQRGDDLAANAQVISDGIRTLEVEVDVITPGESTPDAAVPESVRSMTGDIQNRAADARRERSAKTFGQAVAADLNSRPAPLDPDVPVESWDDVPTTPITQPHTTETW